MEVNSTNQTALTKTGKELLGVDQKPNPANLFLLIKAYLCFTLIKPGYSVNSI